MSFTYINKILIIIFLLIIYGCHGSLISSNSNIENQKDNKIVSSDFKQIDFSSVELINNNVIDYYTQHPVDVDFVNDKNKKIKINNFENKIKNNLTINLIISGSEVFSVNSSGNLLKFDIETGKLIERYHIKISDENKIPVSFTSIENDFVIGYRSGEIIKVDKKGNIKWSYKNNNFLNTPIKYFDKSLIALYPEHIVILSSKDGNLIFEKDLKSGNIFQSSGGKVVKYFNFIYFLLPNSTFHSIDTFLFEEHLSDLNNIEINTSLNNMKDDIYLYQNLFVYLDNGNILTTYDLLNNKYLLSNLRLKETDSTLFFNNLLINKNIKYLEFYNIKNGKLIISIDIENQLKKDSEIVKAIMINNNLHIFSNDGKILILDKELNIINKVDLKIRNINKIYSYQKKIFVSIEKGLTFIF